MTKRIVWEVRSGTDGLGMTLCHVYATDMSAARVSAAESLTHANYGMTAELGMFSVHGLRDGETVKPSETLARLGNGLWNRHYPAMDYVAA